jgi:hypothetical protein
VKSHEWLHKLAEPEPSKAALALQRLEEGKPVRIVFQDGAVVIRQVADNQFSVEAANRRITLPKEAVELILWYLDAVFQSWRIELDDEQ